MSLGEFFKGKNELVLENKICEQIFGAGSKLTVIEQKQNKQSISGQKQGRDVIKLELKF